jgi:hypothetical protein
LVEGELILAGRATVPFCGGRSPVRSFMNVDLPAPFGPVSPYRRPAENVVVTSSKRIFEPYRIDTSCTVIIEAPGRGISRHTPGSGRA